VSCGLSSRSPTILTNPQRWSDCRHINRNGGTGIENIFHSEDSQNCHALCIRLRDKEPWVEGYMARRLSQNLCRQWLSVALKNSE
jgi:hypothetical protein